VLDFSAVPKGVDTVWKPQPGSQEVFLRCPVFEVLYEGTRGPGKTDALLMDFLQGVGQGYGAAWRGILFRQSYPELADVIAKSQKWFKLAVPGAEFNKANSTWVFPGGEELLLRHMKDPNDYWKYHGHEYPWIGWEELTTWVDDKCYKVMMSCCRSSTKGVPRRYRATTNPYGKGHNWVKARFRLPYMRGKIIKDAVAADGKPEPWRVAVHGTIHENRILLDADPEYLDKIRAAASNPNQLKAWMEGAWDITSGGIIDDLWNSKVHVVAPFNIPAGWRVDRSFDWGSSKPFAVQWWAQSNGEAPIDPKTREQTFHSVKGDLYLIAQWYGWNRTPNEGLYMLAADVAKGIKEREAAMVANGLVTKKPRPGPADTSIFDEENGNSIGKDMIANGVLWEKADKGPGSRKQGWEQIRKRLRSSYSYAQLHEHGIALPKEPKEGPREAPGLFVFDTCEQFLRTVPVLPRDEKDPDDVDTDAEDHDGDACRYRVRRKVAGVRSGNM
jgi:hypothetical protein